MLHRRHWSVDEANAALPRVAARVERLRTLSELVSSGWAEQRLAGMTGVPGGGYPGRDLAAATVELLVGLEALDEAEIVVRDLDRGLIDFPAVLNGEEVYLCWVRGEREVAHWHAPHAGFLGRRPLG
jgi:hypothetical protein